MIPSTRNQRGNAKNPYQTDAKKVLCVCSAGLLRSPTIANYLYLEKGYNTRSAGSSEQFALVPVSEALLYWADEVIFVSQSVYDEVVFNNQLILNIFEDRSIILDIPDEFCWNDRGIINAFEKQYFYGDF